jgi:hypothetical protein
MTVRILGAAIGSAAPTMFAALLLAVSLPFLLPIVAIVGAPVGALIGFAVGPWLADAPRQVVAARVMMVAGLATVVALVAFSIWQAFGPSGLPLATALLVYSGAVAIVGFPPAVIVSFVATAVLRRIAPNADRLWGYGIGVVALSGVACLLMLPAALVGAD